MKYIKVRAIKWVLINLLIGWMLPEISLGQSLNNGIYVENGKTFEVDKTLHQFTPTNVSEILYFSNELIAKVYTNSDFMINSFYQEVVNVSKPAEKAKFGNHNFAATLLNGTLVIAYSGGDSNSSCVVSTPLADIELHNGMFYFNVTDNKVLVASLMGTFRAHGDKNKITDVGQGFALVAVPNNVGILEAKISMGTEKVKSPMIDKLVNDSKDAIRLKGTIMFTTIGGKLVGVIID